ncbi:hypothetical protein AMTR_s00061p00202530 [Amborella trichopoda]|uniref:Phytocyanin domain-containing protein n=2 Tax=Amborella trichopoda TaxID=13333 RepID=U5DFN7_AMBTC|nr:hypothetical protein AMTR_s00061p00202530 [Amborella trichopoda]
MVVTIDAFFEFRVGGPHGWHQPIGNETETYNQWAARNRFHVGDSIYFKYNNDSVLVVNPRDYLRCNTSNPIFKFEDGDTTFTFERYGFFYFISGQPVHCKNGQKLIVRVMAQSGVLAPAAAPDAGQPDQPGQPGQGGGEGTPSKPPTPNTGVKLAIGPLFLACLGGMMVISPWLAF